MSEGWEPKLAVKTFQNKNTWILGFDQQESTGFALTAKLIWPTLLS